MIILGIDPGTITTGFAVIEVKPAKLHLHDFGSIKPPPKLSLSDRYLIIHDALESLINRFNPQEASLETQFVYRNPQSTIKLCMLRGIIILTLKKNKVLINEYAPKEPKVALTGNGNASKYQIRVMAKQLFNLSELPNSEDAADALALAVCLAHDLQFKSRKGARL